MKTPNRNSDAKYKTVEQIMEETNFCKDIVKRIAREADALIKVGRTLRIISPKFYMYLEAEYKD